MSRIKCTISYDGSGFAGYQVQPGQRTVQAELEKALASIHKSRPVKTAASGRTDAGVHAMGQVIHFDTDLSIPEEKWPAALNSLLPDDISVLKAERAQPDFHARFSAKEKEYRYRIYFSDVRSPFKHHYACMVRFPLDMEAMEEAAESVLGTHDFTSFCSAKTEVEDKIRTLKEIEFLRKEGELVIRFTGDGFLYNMVRILTGTLLEIGSGKRAPGEMRKILEKRNRIFAGKTAPPQGLYLWKVSYGGTG
ncbi:tRNA pseudouridine synthase A [Weizmannia acidilactici]|jgi:tRNA pseudouridine38-40 synthase|uniref:tRNA pseudouridine synthase A n=1 Tax=Weizmannia acidilactici TaxID=2607726 RepID=A0A5J4J4F7_9BACI|nr:tRNA pseudouridine(38-40) synthase TruA [Weizmannia acidilactici]GER67230.1 tRNA pseudouridine synthase A [Weizmannia acidilactici]GER69872.1 tRNA pseudouridine synthase A [Weizmannia acidilactici]GER73349.1 tRNA pseudouridine synthase A [Weizmannia acidilactici]